MFVENGQISIIEEGWGGKGRGGKGVRGGGGGGIGWRGGKRHW